MKLIRYNDPWPFNHMFLGEVVYCLDFERAYGATTNKKHRRFTTRRTTVPDGVPEAGQQCMRVECVEWNVPGVGDMALVIGRDGVPRPVWPVGRAPGDIGTERDGWR